MAIEFHSRSSVPPPKKNLHTQIELKVLIRVFLRSSTLGTLMTSTTDTVFFLFRNNTSGRADCTYKI